MSPMRLIPTLILVGRSSCSKTFASQKMFPTVQGLSLKLSRRKEGTCWWRLERCRQSFFFGCRRVEWTIRWWKWMSTIVNYE